MTITIPSQLKPLAATLMNLQIAYYLRSTNFKNLIWSQALDNCNRSSDIIVVTDTNLYEDTYFTILKFYWEKDSGLFHKFLIATIIGFINTVKSSNNIDRKKLLSCLKEVAIPETKLKEIELLIDQKKDLQKQKHLNWGQKGDVRKVFLGHGQSPVWRAVDDFLRKEGIASEAFESDIRTSEHIIDILKSMLDRAIFAIIVVTAEDETKVGTTRARQNVIHEIGLFQGRLGFNKVAILKQDGTEDFSNIHGLQYIPFYGNKVEDTFYQLRETLKKAGVME